MKNFLAAFAIIGGAISSPALATDRCAINDLSIRQVGDTTYSPTGQPARLQLQIDLVRDCDLDTLDIGSESSTFTLAGPGGALVGQTIGGGAGEVTQNLFRVSPGRLQQLKRNGSLTIDLLQIRPGQFVERGVYTVSLQLTVNGTTAPGFIAALTIEPAIQLLGNAANGRMRVDLGELSKGAAVTTNILYRSNSSMTVQLVSDNGGRLIHRADPQLGAVPYELRVADSIANPGSGSASVPVAFSEARVSRLPVTITVEPAPNRLYAGEYNDVLTFEFTAN